jgi:hypothetical protein
MAAPTSRRPPRWLKYANRINVALLGRGIGPASQRLLSVPGRNTGMRRTTPVAVVALDGERYIVAGYETSDWEERSHSRVGGHWPGQDERAGRAHRSTSRSQYPGHAGVRSGCSGWSFVPNSPGHWLRCRVR